MLAASVDRLLAAYAADVAGASVLRGLLAHRSNLGKPGGGWVLESFWSAWEAFAIGTSYRDVIERAVRLGPDTDTTAAIGDGLAGPILAPPASGWSTSCYAVPHERQRTATSVLQVLGHHTRAARCSRP